MPLLLELFISLGIILFGAKVFTNGIEWLGKKLHLSEGAVGSILAAVGTALPETMVPIIAIFSNKGEIGHDIGVGAILGAPFMLSTLAFFIAGLSVIIYRKNHHNFPYLKIDPVVLERDLSFFILVYSIAIFAAFLGNHSYKVAIAILLIIAYGVYVFLTLTHSTKIDSKHQISPLFFNKRSFNPRLYLIVSQVFVALVIIIIGAKIFVGAIEQISHNLGIPSFILALIITPIATELPEKFNSIIWIAKGKDTLALGNITGAMVFQSSLIPALGIMLTPWILDFKAIFSALLALFSALLVYFRLRTQKGLTAFVLLYGGLFYIVFLISVFTGLIK